jgi:hypothetical protein
MKKSKKSLLDVAEQELSRDEQRLKWEPTAQNYARVQRARGLRAQENDLERQHGSPVRPAAYR